MLKSVTKIGSLLPLMIRNYNIQLILEQEKKKNTLNIWDKAQILLCSEIDTLTFFMLQIQKSSVLSQSFHQKKLENISHSKSKIIESESCSVMSDSLQPHRLYSSWNSSGQNTGVGSCLLLQGIFPTQGLSPGLPHGRQVLYQLSHHQ